MRVSGGCALLALSFRQPKEEKSMGIALFAALFAGVTAGWENICSDRAEFPATEAIWRADFGRKGDFSWELKDGALAAVEVLDEGIRIRKTNDVGYVVVSARPFSVKKGFGVRFTADQISYDADVDYSSGFLRYCHGSKKNYGLSPAENKNFYRGGLQTMRGMPCTAPGMVYRKYAQCYAEDDNVTPVIIVSGVASDSTWKNWFAESLDEARKLWSKKYNSIPPPDRSSQRMDEAQFDKMIAADIEHTASVKSIDGISRLVIDGEVSAPVAYYSRHGECKAAAGAMENFGGHRLNGSAVKLMVKGVGFGRNCDPDGSNFKVDHMVAQIKNAMRIAPDALFILSVSAMTPRDFVQKHHPDEAWINAKGEPVMGFGSSCIIGYMGSTKEQFAKKAFQWPSPSSKVMREWVKRGIRELLAALKEQGLTKRIVGIHTCGFHDGQFSIPYTDFSKPAQEEYRKIISEPGCISTNYAFCMKQAGLRAQEEFVREFKRVLGKPSIGIMWCESPFRGDRRAALHVTSFTRSDAMDIMVCQPSYRERLPGYPIFGFVPVDSLHLHGKLFWNELDYRTYAPIRTSEMGGGAVTLKGLGTAADFPMWQTMYRKVSGESDATRMGYWLYDMSGGWYDTPSLSADIRHHVREEEIMASIKPSKWRPDVAILLDEENILLEGREPLDNMRYTDDFIYSAQCRLFCTSGVPYERFLADDALRRPDLLDGKKMVIFAFFRTIDERRAALVKRLAAQGATLVFLSETAIQGGGEAIGFEPVFKIADNPLSHLVIPEPGVTDNMASMMDQYTMREWVRSVRTRNRCTVKEVEGVKVLARYAEDKLPAVAMRDDPDCRRVYVCEPCGLTPGFMNRLAREAGAYVTVPSAGLQINMNGDFISVHCLRPGCYDLNLPFRRKVLNLKTYAYENVQGSILKLNLTAGETCRFWLCDGDSAKVWDRCIPELRKLADFPKNDTSVIYSK